MGWFDGKAGLVTGAAGGIGRASALAYAQEGGSVIVADLESSRAKGEETVELITRAGGNAAFVAVDVSSDEQVKNLIDTTVSTFGRLDFALNNAGIVATGFTADIGEDAWDRVFEVDIKGVWLCLKYELLYMKENGGGAIVNTASESGLVGTPMASPYVAAKHAVVGLTKTAAGEYANLGIRINAIAPGAVWTPMMASYPVEVQQLLLAPQPMHRFGAVEEIANAVVWLSSDKASFITGITLPIDGGATASAQSFDPNLSPSVAYVDTPMAANATDLKTAPPDLVGHRP